MRNLRNLSFWIAVGVVALIIAYGATCSAIRRETWFTVLLFVGLASSLNILLGYTGYVSFGHVVFFGFGGYIGFWAIDVLGMNLWLAALLGGIVSALLALSFGLGTMLAALAGGLIAMALPFTILSGGSYELKSFVIVVLGGLGNPIGALLGGVILGLIEGLVPVFTKITWVPVIEFVLFVLILLVRPQGLFGAKQ